MISSGAVVVPCNEAQKVYIIKGLIGGDSKKIKGHLPVYVQRSHKNTAVKKNSDSKFDYLSIALAQYIDMKLPWPP